MLADIERLRAGEAVEPASEPMTADRLGQFLTQAGITIQPAAEPNEGTK